MESLEESAELIEAEPEETWSRWVIFLLEILDSDALLENLRDAISQRLFDGMW